MQLVILAAGKGTRMNPITIDIPKPMVPLLGKPKLEYTLDSLPKEIDEVILVVNYLASQIKEHFGDEYGGRKIRYILQETLDGTGGAIKICRDVLRGNFLVMMGDDLYSPEDVKRMISENLAILTFQSDQIGRFSRVVSDQDGNLLEITDGKEASLGIEGDGEKLINTGLYALNQSFFDYELARISKTEFGLPQTLAKMITEHKVKVLKTKKWVPLGKIDDVAIAEKKLAEVFSL